MSVSGSVLHKVFCVTIHKLRTRLHSCVTHSCVSQLCFACVMCLLCYTAVSAVFHSCVSLVLSACVMCLCYTAYLLVFCLCICLCFACVMYLLVSGKVLHSVFNCVTHVLHSTVLCNCNLRGVQIIIFYHTAASLYF